MSPTVRRSVIALSISAALNVFLAGFITARFLFAPPDGPPGYGPPPLSGPRSMLLAAEAVGAKAPLRRLLRERRAKLDPGRKALRQARRDVAKALQGEPFDAEAMRAAFARMRAATEQSQQALHETLVDLAKGLSPEQRRKLARARDLWPRHPDQRPPRDRPRHRSPD